MTMADDLLVIGASGPTGRALLPLLRASGHTFTAASRTEHDSPDTRWRQLTLQSATGPELARTILSLGPLDHLAQWLARVPTPNLARVVALGSISVQFKSSSPSDEERALAARLAAAEATLLATARQRGFTATIVRAGMIWDGETDQNVAPWLRQARRWKVWPCPHRAGGRRNPIATTDLAQVLLATLTASDPPDVIEAGGPEILTMQTLMRRIALRSGAWPVPIPMRVCQWIAATRLAGPRTTRLREVLGRWDQDQLAAIHPSATRKFLEPPPEV